MDTRQWGVAMLAALLITPGSSGGPSMTSGLQEQR
jgi:hypothetical protein